MPQPIVQVAAKAVLVNPAGQVLILREADTSPNGTNPGKYHLPGGRLEAGETFHQALRREIKEETCITDVTSLYPLHVDEWRPVIHGQETQIVGIFVLCTTPVTAVTLSNEHDEQLWIDPADYAAHALLKEDAAALQAFLARPAASSGDLRLN